LSTPRTITLVAGDTEGVIPLPVSTLNPAALNKALIRLRKNAHHFEYGTTHEPALYYLHMLYLLSAQPEEKIDDAAFQANVLQTLSKMIYIYRYHIPTSNQIKQFAGKLQNSAIQSKTEIATGLNYNPTLFIDSNIVVKQTKSFKINGPTDRQHPEEILQKK
jgi:hypothetical protein